jgi:hypothetical protein
LGHLGSLPLKKRIKRTIMFCLFFFLSILTLISNILLFVFVVSGRTAGVGTLYLLSYFDLRSVTYV